jgi:hypothetical protein
MKNDALIRDPVFQMNLLVWMAKEQPAQGYRIRPFFHELGFQIVYLQQTFAFPEETLQAIQQASMDIAANPEPEMVLRHSDKKRALYFEAKGNSFSPDSTTSKQARGHLLACGPAFAEVMEPLKQALLCYLLPADKRDAMANCLAALATELRGSKLKPGSHSVHGLSVNGTDLSYSWDDGFKIHCGLAADSVVVLENLQEDTDPTPLLLVYADDDSPNEQHGGFYRRAFLQQVLATLLCDMNHLSLDQIYTTTARDLILRTSDGMTQYMPREKQTRLARLVHKNLLARIAAYWKDKSFPPAKLEGDSLHVSYKDNLAKEQFLDWLEDSKKTNFSDQPAGQETPLIPGLLPNSGENN